MEKFTKFVEEKIAPPLIKFSQMKYVQVMQRMGLGVMSIFIIGSLFLIFASFPYQPYLDFLGDFRWTLAEIAGAGTSFIGLYTVVTIAYGLTEWYNENQDYNMDKVQTVILSLASFLILNPIKTVDVLVEEGMDPEKFAGIPTQYLGALGVFTAIIVGIVSVEIFRFFIKKNIVIKLPGNVPPMVSQAFVALIPGFFVLVFWWLLGSVLKINIPEIIQSIFQPLVRAGDTPAAVVLLTFLNRLLWSVGIHGSNIVASVAGPIYSQMGAANLEAFQATGSLLNLPYTYTTPFMDNYVWTGLFPLALVMTRSKSPRLKSLGLLALPATLFNIGEPLIFGIPIMLNPVLMIPFILSYVVLSLVAILLHSIGFLAVPALTVPWIMPAPIKAFLATNSDPRAFIYVIVSWAVLALVFYPFVKVLEKQDLEKIEQEEKASNNKKVIEG